MTKHSKQFFFTRVVLIAISLVFAMPFLWMLATSLKPDHQLFDNYTAFFPVELAWDNYSQAISYFPFWTYLGNSILITAGSVLGTVLVSPLVAYSFSKIKWPGRGLCFALMLSTILLPSAATLVPTFLVFKNLHLIDTYWPLILPAFSGVAAHIFLIRQFLSTIPNVLIEAARIDGAGEWQIYRLIILPLTKPVLLIIALFQFVAAWNNYLGPLLYLNRDQLYPLSLGLPLFMSKYGTHWNWMMAAATLSIIPTFIFFLFAQRYLIEGIKMSGIKG